LHAAHGTEEHPPVPSSHDRPLGQQWPKTQHGGTPPLSRAKHVADANAAVRRGDVVAAETSNMLVSQVRLDTFPPT
jgi:hypothetical protein